MASLLKGVGFITGAASGIGKATAQSFAKHGVRQLALGDLNIKALKDTAAELKNAYPGLEVLPLELNTASEKSVEDSISATVKNLGRIEYAVNNAGIAGAAWKSADSDLAGWQKTMDVNLTGVWLCSRAEIRTMLKQDPLEPDNPRLNRGVIVNVASMYGTIATNATVGNVSYTATKHGIVGMTKADAIAYAREGIRINAICPGYVATPLLQKAGIGMQGEIERTPINRLASMEEIGDSIVYMASPLSSFMYGAAMVVDGGYTIQ